MQHRGRNSDEFLQKKVVTHEFKIKHSHNKFELKLIVY